MLRTIWAALVPAIVGCSGSPAPEVPNSPLPANVPVPVVPPTTSQALTPPEPLLTPESAPDLTVTPTPAGRIVDRYRPRENYPHWSDGKTPAPTPIPVLPVRRPTRVLGDLRYFAANSGSGGVALSPNGKRLALGTSIFDATTGELDATYDTNGNSVHRLEFSPDGTRLYCGEGPLGNLPTHGNRLRVRDVPGRQQLLSIPMTAWCLIADGSLLATLQHVYYDPSAGKPGLRPMLAHYYPAIRIYDTKTWKGVAGYRVRGARPTTVALSPDGGQVLIGCGDGAVRVWDRTENREVAVLRELCEPKSPTHQPIVQLIAFSPDGKTLAAANARPHDSDTPRQVALWKWPDGTLLHMKSAGTYDPTDLRFSSVGRFGAFLFCGRPSGAFVWNVTSGDVVTELQRDRDNRWVPAVSFAETDRVFASGGSRPALLRFPSLEPLPWPERPFDKGPPKVPFELFDEIPPNEANKGRHIEIALPDGGIVRKPPIFEGGVQVIDRTGKVVHHFEKGRVIALDVSPDGKLLAAFGHNANGQGFDYPLRFWDTATGAEAAAIRVDPQPGYSMRFSPDSKRLAVVHADGIVRIWDVAARKPLFALDGDGYWPTRLTYSKDGRFLLMGTPDSPVFVVWDVTEDARP